MLCLAKKALVESMLNVIDLTPNKKIGLGEKDNKFELPNFDEFINTETCETVRSSL